MNGITSRLQVFLAKIAGKDVDVSTLTPPVAINEEEKLMLDIADRIDTIEESSGGDSDVFTVNFVWGDDSFICNHTFAEIVAALEAGKVLIATDNGGYGGTSIYYSVRVDGSYEIDQVSFDFWEPDPETPNVYIANKIVITASGITDSYTNYLLTPAS